MPSSAKRVILDLDRIYCVYLPEVGSGFSGFNTRGHQRHKTEAENVPCSVYSVIAELGMQRLPFSAFVSYKASVTKRIRYRACCESDSFR